MFKIGDSTLYDLLWMSARYCIGRHTIASSMHASHIAMIIRDNPDATLDVGQFGNQILDEINGICRLCSNVHADYNVPDIMGSILLSGKKDIKAGIAVHYKLYQDGDQTHIETMEKGDFSGDSNTFAKEYYDLMPWYKLAMWILSPLWITVHMDDGNDITKKGFRFWDSYGEERYIWSENYEQRPGSDMWLDNYAIKEVRSCF